LEIAFGNGLSKMLIQHQPSKKQKLKPGGNSTPASGIPIVDNCCCSETETGIANGQQ